MPFPRSTPDMFRILRILALSCFLTFPTQSASVRKVSLNLCCLRYADSARTLLLKKDPSSPPEEVAFYQGGFTRKVPVLIEDDRIVVYRKGDEEQKPWIQDWTFPVPRNQSSLSVILLPRPPDPTKSNLDAPYTAYTLPTVDNFGYGSVLAVNLTPFKTQFHFGSQKVTLSPGNSRGAELGAEADSFNMVPVSAWIHAEGKWRSLHTSQWAYNRRYRQVSLIWMDASTKRTEITSIREMQPMATVPAAE